MLFRSTVQLRFARSSVTFCAKRDSTEFINKMNLKNVVVLHKGKAFSFVDELEDEDIRRQVHMTGRIMNIFKNFILQVEKSGTSIFTHSIQISMMLL